MKPFDITIDDTNVGEAFELQRREQQRRLRRDPRPRRRARRAGRARRGDHAHAGRPRARPRRRLARSTGLVFSMNRSRTILVPPRVLPGRAQTCPGLRRAGGARLRPRRTQPGSRPPRPTTLVDQLLGIPGADAGGVTARRPQRLPGDLQARASSAIDGDPSTAWSTPFGQPCRAVDRRRCGAAGHVRPPRPAGRRGRAPLRARRDCASTPAARPAPSTCPRSGPAGRERDDAGDRVVRPGDREERARSRSSPCVRSRRASTTRTRRS